MARKPNSSKQTEALLSVLLGTKTEWGYGYDLSRETGLKSGTLYPILMRLEGHGWLEARWEEEPVPGKPRRHLYRLTDFGVREATALLQAARQRGQGARFATAGEAGSP